MPLFCFKLVQIIFGIMVSCKRKRSMARDFIAGRVVDCPLPETVNNIGG